VTVCEGVEIVDTGEIEEEIFYPAYKRAAETRENAIPYFEAQEEHALVAIVLPELEATSPSSEVFGAKAKVLKDLIEHHADEEEDEMLPKAKKLLGKERLGELGAEMAARKEELLHTPRKRGARAQVTVPDRAPRFDASARSSRPDQVALRTSPDSGRSSSFPRLRRERMLARVSPGVGRARARPPGARSPPA